MKNSAIFESIQEQLTQQAGSMIGDSPYILPFFLECEEDRPCIVICPGGGYAMTSPRESEPVAKVYNAQGFHAIVVHYRVAPHRHPAPLDDLSLCMSLLRQNAKALKLRSNKMFVCGFSAGGHLAASLGVHWNKDFLQEKLEIKESNQPNGLILCYPVITSEEAHWGSFENLLGKEHKPEELEFMNLNHHVGDHTPPSFLWHTVEDVVVPVGNSLRFAKALGEKDIPYEMHLFPKGIHGLSLAIEEVFSCPEEGAPDKHVAKWLELSASWIKEYHL